MINEKIEIDVRREEWSDAVNSKNLNKYLDVVSEDVVWFPPGQSVIIGRNRFREWVKPFFDSYNYQFEIIEPRVSVSGAWATEKGMYKPTLTQGEKKSTHTGHYLIIWQRRTDSVWRIDRYVDVTGLLRESA